MNNQKKKISTGVEDFKEIIDKNGYLVDKTLMIKELLESNAKVTLFTRPRRFGKTLNQSMIRRFLEDEITKDGKRIDNRYLFEGLAISRCGDDILKHQQQYPVIFLSLKSSKQDTYEDSLAMLRKEIANEFRRHEYVLNSDTIAEDQKEVYRDIMTRKAEPVEYRDALKFLSECLAEYHGKNTIILLDEYDVPLENAYTEGFYPEMMKFIRSLFESALKTNPSLERGIITGCLRISRESIFTGLNNLEVHSIRSPYCDDKFGFRDDEVKEILDYYGFADKYPEVKEWYDGYLFGKTEIYNPWSILSYVKSLLLDPDALPEAHWSNTSSNDIVRELAENADSNVRSDLETLMSGGSIEKPVHEDITYGNIHTNQDNLWNFLFFTGYLKRTGTYTDDETTYLELAIPNKEVRLIYKRTIKNWFDARMKSIDNTDLIKALEDGDCEAAEKFINRHLKKTMSYFDTLESFYHGFMAGLLLLTNDYEVDSNKESGDGRPDIVLKDESGSIDRAIILEFKVAKSKKQLESKCDEALEQIEKKEYADPFIDAGYDIVQKYGITFCQKKCMIKQGETYRK